MTIRRASKVRGDDQLPLDFRKDKNGGKRTR
jgi:hypothetical protein